MAKNQTPPATGARGGVSLKTATLMMAVCALLWSISGVFIKMLPWNPIVISGWRSLISAGVFACYFVWRRYRLVVNPRTFLCGMFLCGTMLLYIAACKLTTSANAIILQSSSPIFIMVLGTLFYGDHYRKSEYAMVVVVLCGIALFFFDQLTPGGIVGNLLAICSGVTLGSMFLMSSRLPDEESSQSALLLGHLLTAAIGVPLTLLFPTPVNATTVGSILVLGVLQLGIPYILYGIAVRVCSPLSCSLIGMIEPLFNPVWVMLVIGEVPGLFALIGGVIVLGTVSLWMISNAAIASRQQKAAREAAQEGSGTEDAPGGAEETL